jgi:hypothetical protein
LFVQRALTEGVGDGEVAHDEGTGEELGASPMRRHHPLATSILARSFTLEFERSTAVRRA